MSKLPLWSTVTSGSATWAEWPIIWCQCFFWFSASSSSGHKLMPSQKHSSIQIANLASDVSARKKIIKSKLHLLFSLQAQFTTEILARAITCLGSLLTRGLRLVVLTGSLPGSKLAITAGGSAWTQFLLTLGPSMKPLLASSKTVMNRTIVENSPGQWHIHNDYSICCFLVSWLKPTALTHQETSRTFGLVGVSAILRGATAPTCSRPSQTGGSGHRGAGRSPRRTAARSATGPLQEGESSSQT